MTRPRPTVRAVVTARWHVLGLGLLWAGGLWAGLRWGPQ